jgi:hypothetical protein
MTPPYVLAPEKRPRVGAAALAPGCSANPLLVGREIDDGGPSGNNDGGNSDGGRVSACASAGGTCIYANTSCAKGAPVGAQDCPLNGAFCCLAPL